MSTTKFKGTLVTGHLFKQISTEFEFDTEDELRTWLEDEHPGEHRYKHTARPVVQEGFHTVTRYTWENGQLQTDVKGFETLEDAKAYAEDFDDHQVAKIYSPNGELLHETGPLASGETYA
jgi:hypothetical protein